jgi:hypothetical protein
MIHALPQNNPKMVRGRLRRQRNYEALRANVGAYLFAFTSLSKAKDSSRNHQVVF